MATTDKTPLWLDGEIVNYCTPDAGVALKELNVEMDGFFVHIAICLLVSGDKDSLLDRKA